MGDMADDLEHQEYQENSRWHHELNPRGIKTSEDFAWVTRDGKKLKLSEMTDTHIANCIALLGRSLAQRPPEQHYMGDSDFAEDAVEAENRHNERLAASLEKAIEIFRTELNHRGYTGRKLRNFIGER